jgi:hypothetical protein
MREVHQM